MYVCPPFPSVCVCLPDCLCVCACAYEQMKVKNQLVMESVFSFHCGSSGDSAQAVKVWRRCLYPRSHLAGAGMFSFIILASFLMQFSVRSQHCYATDLEDVFHRTNGNSSSFFMSLATSALHSAFRGCEFDCSPCILRANYIALLSFV